MLHAPRGPFYSPMHLGAPFGRQFLLSVCGCTGQSSAQPDMRTVFSILKFLPHKRTIFCNNRVFIKYKESNSTIFEIHKWLADLVSLALISPLWH
jgi:hypothetical protein